MTPPTPWTAWNVHITDMPHVSACDDCMVHGRKQFITTCSIPARACVCMCKRVKRPNILRTVRMKSLGRFPAQRQRYTVGCNALIRAQPPSLLALRGADSKKTSPGHAHTHDHAGMLAVLEFAAGIARLPRGFVGSRTITQSQLCPLHSTHARTYAAGRGPSCSASEKIRG